MTAARAFVVPQPADAEDRTTLRYTAWVAAVNRVAGRKVVGVTKEKHGPAVATAIAGNVIAAGRILLLIPPNRPGGVTVFFVVDRIETNDTLAIGPIAVEEGATS